MKTATIYAGLALVLASMTEAHITMWNKGLFGYNYPYQAGDKKQNYNGNSAVAPLRKYDNLTVDQWFAHGYKDYPPAKGDFMELVSGSNYTGDLACNRALTHMRDPSQKDKPLNYYACPDKGPLHTMNEFNKTTSNKWFGGTAIAIAYTSNVTELEPNDMTVISVNYSSVWEREVVYQIPKGMPKCPEGGCLCTWNWYHRAGHGEGYGYEFYNTLYRCQVTGQTSTETGYPIGTGALPKLCEKNPEQCTVGPKTPMYAWMVSGNNMADPPDVPTYDMRYGFKDGAQMDVFKENAVIAKGAGERLLPAVMVVVGALGLALSPILA